MNKSKLFMIISIFIFIISLSGSTYSMWKYTSSTNANVNTITYGLDYFINYNKGQDIVNGILNASTNYISDNNTSIDLWKDDDTYDIYGHIYLDINEIGVYSSASSSLKYTLISNNTVIKSGTLQGTMNGSNILIKSNIPLSTDLQTFTVYIWLDASEDIDSNMIGENLSVSVRCTATMEELGTES